MRVAIGILAIYVAFIIAAILLNKPSYCEYCEKYKAVRKLEE